MIPRKTTTAEKKEIRTRPEQNMAIAWSFRFSARYFENTGIKERLNMPSATIFLSTSKGLKVIKKISETIEAPKTKAIIPSLITPSTLETRVNAEMEATL